ncbi:Pls/PosA family non-ribosomal peptide synthetase [Streptomyces sp. Tue6028]|uniref:Pls/PosA family non-ribosomal peptide synthetase n=1 Tax=Streptomyces sp. Tue6028 TaxID=2036037 RepID=UPI003EBE202F
MVEKSSEVHIAGPDRVVVGEHSSAGALEMDTESKFAEVLAQVTCVQDVPVDAHFFDDLGANSLVMAQFCARIRKIPGLPSASMKDIYRNPSIRSLAAALTVADPATVGVHAQTSQAVRTTPVLQPMPHPTNKLNYFLCGTFQLSIFLAYSVAFGLITARGYAWVAAGSGVVDIYLRSVVFGSCGLLAVFLLPIAAKWILIGRSKPCEFPVWGLAYMRFWIVKSLLHSNPIVLLAGNPLFVLYLRALGARIGSGVTILSHSVPVCADLLTIGSGSVIRKDSSFLCYRAHAGRIQTGRVTLGRDVFVGEKTVLDIDTSMGDGAQLGHASALHRGQAIPAGEHRHGSPAQPTDIEHVRVAPASCGALRRTWFGLVTVLQMFFLYVPLGVGGLYMLFIEVPELGRRLGPDTTGLTTSVLVTDALYLSVVVFFGFVVLGLIWLYTVPRVLNLAVRPDKVYPLYGFHYAAHRAIARMTNIKFFGWLFGDSSYVVHYLRGLGYDLSRVQQTGSNFGTELQQDNPYLVTVGTGTMVADGLSIVNADYSSTSFRVSRASIGPHNFLGNNIAYPAGGRTGKNCLLATKVLIPLDGEIREGVGLLGSPSFEIPRSVERDARFDDIRTGDELRRRLSAKNRYNLRSMAVMLFARWVFTFVLTLFALASIDFYGVFGHVVIAAYLAITLAFTAGYYILVERLAGRFRRLTPQLCSIYDPVFWWHERIWKVPDQHLNIFNGTPFKNVIWRLMGVRIGKRVFDDGCYLTERTLATIGDECTLNFGSKIQCHSQEDGTFKSDVSTLGAGCTLGVGAHVHYGVTMGDGAVLAADSFLMKGEEVPARARWGGNPAADMPDLFEQQPFGVETLTATTPSVNGTAAKVGS